jgi:hypothetical protein
VGVYEEKYNETPYILGGTRHCWCRSNYYFLMTILYETITVAVHKHYSLMYTISRNFRSESLLIYRQQRTYIVYSLFLFCARILSSL